MYVLRSFHSIRISLRHRRVPIASSSNPHCILMAFSLRNHGSYLMSVQHIAFSLRPHCVLIASSLRPHCVLIASSLCLYYILLASLLHLFASSFHPPHVLISSFSCMSSTYSFYNPLVSVSSFHYILTFLIHMYKC